MTDTRKEFDDYFVSSNPLESMVEYEKEVAMESWQACQQLNDKRIADLLAVIELQRDALQKLYDTQNGCPLHKYEDDWNEAMRLTSEALAITPESVELVEFACTIENGVNNNINDYALYKREDAEMHCRGECANGFSIVPLYTIKQKG